VRAVPVFNAFTFTDDGSGGHLTPRPPEERGTSPAVTNNNLRRCPGASGPSPTDRSAPFVDDGDLANPDCDPSQSVGATG
jgi:phospholipid/cholesterol/gamma-HCH transport system substrate-binding protein